MPECPPCAEPDNCYCEEMMAMQQAREARYAEPKRYRTIVVDPPWQYGQKLAEDGADSHYGTMSEESLTALPIASFAEPDAHLYLWTTNAFMAEAHRLVEAWGFDQKTILTWIKGRRSQEWLGMGFYYRNNTEHVLFCVRGSLRCQRTDVGTHFFGERKAHSEKPAAFYDMVESMSPGPYLDVFARKLRFNWDAWGDEVGAPDGLPTPEQVRARG